MPRTRLVKNGKVVKLPVQSGSVKSAFENAMAKAREQKWNRVIIMGEGKSEGHYYRSRMTDTQALGFLEIVKSVIIMDING